MFPDISPNFRWNTYDASVAKKLIDLEKTPEAIKYFSEVCDKLTDYAYWFLLSTLWVSYSGWSDLNLWKKLFSADKPKRKTSIMKPSEVKAYDYLPWFITVYRAHRPNETDWIAYTLDKDIAMRFAKERSVNSIKEYKFKKKDITAVFLRRGEHEVIAVDKNKAIFIREHFILAKEMSITPWIPEDKGLVCLPLKSNIPDPKNKDWKLVNCPVCNQECWESHLATEALQYKGMKPVCTMCAFKIGMQQKGV